MGNAFAVRIVAVAQFSFYIEFVAFVHKALGHLRRAVPQEDGVPLRTLRYRCAAGQRIASRGGGQPDTGCADTAVGIPNLGVGTDISDEHNLIE